MEDPSGATPEGTVDQTKPEKKAQGMETQDCPESPAPPHSEAPQQPPAQQLEELLTLPPLGERLPHKNLHPSYINKDLDREATTRLLLSQLPFSIIL